MLGHLHPFGSEYAGYSAQQIFAPYSVYKGKAALSMTPVLPSFTKLEVRFRFMLFLQLLRCTYICGVG